MPSYTYESAYAPAPAFPRHVVTAIVVAHDGERWLPRTLAGLTGQERPAQSVVAVDTGSTDETPTILNQAVGAAHVVRADRRATFGEAVDEALRTLPYADPATLPYPIDGPSDPDPFGEGATGLFDADGLGPQTGGPARERGMVEWLWLLHDDSEPAPDALFMLLRAADELPSAAVLGPKVRSWFDRRQLLEVGTTIAPNGRRWTGLERREQDQGQHDAVRGVLSVGSPGMLVRRDVWEQLGGFDPHLPMCRDDTDFGWRVNAAGHRVVVVPDAVVQHAEAATRERRAIHNAPPHPHRIDRAGAVFTLLANSPGRRLALTWLRLLWGTLVGALGYLIGKQPRTAVDEFVGGMSVLAKPFAVLGARNARRRTSRIAAEDLRSLFPARGATTRHAIESLFSSFTRRVEPEMASRRARPSVLESGPTSDDAESLEAESFSRLRFLASRPGLALAVALTLVTLVSARSLLTGGQLFGGALAPPPAGASDLWARFTESFHTIGPGSQTDAPPYLAVVAAVATLFLGTPSTAISVLLIGCVPLAGISAYLSARRLVANAGVRAWGAAAYALLPVATGAIANGRLGTAVVLVLAPMAARGAAQVIGAGFAPTWRSAWATGLVLGFATAFVPLTWIAAVILAAAALVASVVTTRALDKGLALRLVVVLGTPLVLLVPWTATLLGHPAQFLLEPGLASPALAHRGTSPLGLLLMSPGGPGPIPYVFGVGILLAALAALLRDSRRTAVIAAWASAGTGLVLAVVVSRMNVTVPADGTTAPAWPGVATVLVGLGLLAAAVVGAENARGRIAAINFGWRQPAAVLLVGLAAVAPLASAGWWMWKGVQGPVRRGTPNSVPAFVASESETVDRVRTLSLTVDTSGAVRYTIVRDGGMVFGDPDVAPSSSAYRSLSTYLSALLSGSGSADARDLTGYAVEFVVLNNGGGQANGDLAARLDGTPGLTRVSTGNGTAVWRLTYPVSRVGIEAPGAAFVQVPSGEESVSTTLAPTQQDGVLRLAEPASSHWKATLGGHTLKSQTVDGWAQGFVLPAGSSGHLSVTYQPGSRGWLLGGEALALLVVVILALPARGGGNDDDLPAEVVAGAGTGRRRAGRTDDPQPAPQPEPEQDPDTSQIPLPVVATGAQGAAGDDWEDLGQYAQGFQPREGLPGPREGDSGEVPQPVEQVGAAGAWTQGAYDSGAYPAADGYGGHQAYPGYQNEGYPNEYGQQVPVQGEYPAADYPNGYTEYPQPGYGQEAYPQQGYPQEGYAQPGYAQPGYDQNAYEQSAYDQSGYAYGPFPQQQAGPDQAPPPPGYPPPGDPGAPGQGDAVEPTHIWRHGDDDPWQPAPGSRP